MVQALQIQVLQIPKRSFRFLNGHSDRSRPTLFPLVRPRTSRLAQWRNLSSIPRASRAQIFPVTVRLTFTFRFPHPSYKRLFPVARRNLCVPVNLIRLRVRTSFVWTRRLAWWRFLVAIRLWRDLWFGTERFLSGFHDDPSFSLQI